MYFPYKIYRLTFDCNKRFFITRIDITLFYNASGRETRNVHVPLLYTEAKLLDLTCLKKNPPSAVCFAMIGCRLLR